MRAYTEFSKYYDAMMHDVDYTAWTAYVARILSEYGTRTVVDAACGTGNLTIPLCNAGFEVTGIDRSEDMLNVAQQKARQAGVHLPFVCQDMCTFSVHKPVDAVLCCCDGLNYLTSLDEVAAFFRSCFNALRPTGVLLFDVSSAYKLEFVLGCETFTEITDSYAYIWQNSFDVNTRLCRMDVCFFVKDGTRYDRFSEQHIQRAHTTGELCLLAEKAGFAVDGLYAFGTRHDVGDHCERIQFILRKGRV